MECLYRGEHAVQKRAKAAKSCSLVALKPFYSLTWFTTWHMWIFQQAHVYMTRARCVDSQGTSLRDSTEMLRLTRIDWQRDMSA